MLYILQVLISIFMKVGQAGEIPERMHLITPGTMCGLSSKKTREQCTTIVYQVLLIGYYSMILIIAVPLPLNEGLMCIQASLLLIT